MTPMPGIDPATMARIQALLKQNPQLLQTLMAGGAGPGAMPPGGMGATGPGAMPPANPMPSLSAAPSMATPGMTPSAPSPGGQSPFGPPPGAPQLPPPSGPPPQPPQAGPSGPMDPQMAGVNMVLGQAGFGGQERALDRQSQMADELRNTRMPGMGGNSRVQVAASPLEFASAGLARIGGQKMMRDTDTARDDLFKKRMGQLRSDAGLPPQE